MVSQPLVHLILNGSRSRCLVSVRMMRSWSLLALIMNLFFVASMKPCLVPRLLVFQVVILICYVTVFFSDNLDDLFNKLCIIYYA